MIWEYFKLWRLDTDEFNESEFLNEKGKEGWELCGSPIALWVRKQAKDQNDKPINYYESELQWHYYFKRPKVKVNGTKVG